MGTSLQRLGFCTRPGEGVASSGVLLSCSSCAPSSGAWVAAQQAGPAPCPSHRPIEASTWQLREVPGAMGNACVSFPEPRPLICKLPAVPGGIHPLRQDQEGGPIVTHRSVSISPQGSVGKCWCIPLMGLISLQII